MDLGCPRGRFGGPKRHLVGFEGSQRVFVVSQGTFRGGWEHLGGSQGIFGGELGVLVGVLGTPLGILGWIWGCQQTLGGLSSLGVSGQGRVAEGVFGVDFEGILGVFGGLTHPGPWAAPRPQPRAAGRSSEPSRAAPRGPGGVPWVIPAHPGHPSHHGGPPTLDPLPKFSFKSPPSSTLGSPSCIFGSPTHFYVLPTPWGPPLVSPPPWGPPPFLGVSPPP